MSDIEVSETVTAKADRLYELVSDLPRMGEWSPENTGGKWLGGATASLRKTPTLDSPASTRSGRPSRLTSAANACT